MRMIPHRALWVLGFVGVVALVGGVIFLWPSRKPLLDQPSPELPAWLAELGDDPDGDGIPNAEELRQRSNPLVADYPHLQFRFTDVEFGLRIDTTHGGVEDELTVRSEDLLTTHHTSLTESVERTHRK